MLVAAEGAGMSWVRRKAFANVNSESATPDHLLLFYWSWQPAPFQFTTGSEADNLRLLSFVFFYLFRATAFVVVRSCENLGTSDARSRSPLRTCPGVIAWGVNLPSLPTKLSIHALVYRRRWRMLSSLKIRQGIAHDTDALDRAGAVRAEDTADGQLSHGIT